MKKYGILLLVSIGAGYLGAYLFHYKEGMNSVISTKNNTIKTNELRSKSQLTHSNPFTFNTKLEGAYDFIDASRTSMQSVVYIKNISEHSYRMSFMDMFFYDGDKKTKKISSGSGVIFTTDGYIVSNNHVVEGADKLEVIIGKDTYQAKLIGTDPSTDLSVLKIEGEHLVAIPLGSSKELQVGEGVIAVGNPFNLTSTVTSGIISAKARALNIVQDKFPIESFIQTDAAINPGNSGGALVNNRGELVGINTAILSHTGSYAGYGFAVPVDIVKKVVEDIIKYGEVQKAIIGLEVSNLTQKISEELNLKIENFDGVLVTTINTGFSAQKAGIQEGDILVSLDNTLVNTKAEFDELISYYSPGDEVLIKWKKKDKLYSKNIILTNREGTSEILKRSFFTSTYLGADLEIVSKVEKSILGINNGIKITKLYKNGLLARMGIKNGIIITGINNYIIDTPQQLTNILTNLKGRVRVEGVNTSGVKGYYTFYLR